jgi:hypothetical protein
MAKADFITTAIREVMSRGERARFTSPARLAHVESLEKLFAALHVYLTATIADTAQNIPGGTLDRRYFGSVYSDLSADAVCVIRNAAEEMRQHENWRAS